MASESPIPIAGAAAARYSTAAVVLHWLIAALLLTQLYVGFMFHRVYERGTPERAEMFAWHKTLGVAILILALIRLAIRLMCKPPPFPADAPAWRAKAATWGHRFLYLMMILMPLTGLLAVSGRAEGGMVDLQLGLQVPAIPGVPKENDFGDVHELLVWLTMLTLVGHVLAALYWQFVDRGSVAGRMWPFRSTRAA